MCPLRDGIQPAASPGSSLEKGKGHSHSGGQREGRGATGSGPGRTGGSQLPQVWKGKGKANSEQNKCDNTSHNKADAKLMSKEQLDALGSPAKRGSPPSAVLSQETAGKVDGGTECPSAMLSRSCQDQRRGFIKGQ